MSFAVAFPTHKRVKTMTLLGVEELEERDDVDLTYLRILNSDKGEDDEAGKAEADVKPKADPDAVIQKFEDAKGELDVVLDLVLNLERGLHLDLQVVTKARGAGAGAAAAAAQLQDLANENLSRLGRRRQGLQDVAARLSRGAAALRAHLAREASFYNELAVLQKFWKLRLKPLSPDSPFLVDLSLGDPSQGGGAADKPGVSSPLSQVSIIKDSSGSLRVHLEPPTNDAPSTTNNNKTAALGELYIGARSVHHLLLAMQRRLLWWHLSAGLEAEVSGVGPAALSGGTGGALNNFMFSLAKLVVTSVVSSSDARLAAVRPLLLEHFVSARLSGATVAPPPRPYTVPLSAMPLLPELTAWLKHMYHRDYLRTCLSTQAHSLPSVRLHWAPTTQPATSAMLAVLGPQQHRLLIMMRGATTEVEGVVHQRANSRWARDTVTMVYRHHILHLLPSLMATLPRCSRSATADAPQAFEAEEDVVERSGRFAEASTVEAAAGDGLAGPCAAAGGEAVAEQQGALAMEEDLGGMLASDSLAQEQRTPQDKGT